MRKQSEWIGTAVLAMVLAGCASARLYPLKGPLSTQTPPPVLKGTMSGAFFSGSFKVTLPGGELCQGHWATVSRDNLATASPAEAALNAEMASIWDMVYGYQFYTGQVLGSKYHVKGVLTGTKGSTVNVELYKPPEDVGENLRTSVENIKGIAKDSNGNIFKIALR
jgi:hypothetical protein